jgi:glycosyltransferase involved in cell wall biosynthesis
MLETEKPLVSLFVVCYNHARFVYKALESARKQTYQNIELIILDDCSSDRSVEIIENWIVEHQVNCKFIKHPTNVGVVRSLNECIRISSGKFVSFFAADDCIFNNKTELLLKYLISSAEDVGLAYGDLEVIDAEGKQTKASFYDWCLEGTPPAEGYIFESYLARNSVHILGAIIRREVYDKVGYYDEELMYEDWDMGMRMARKFKFLYVPEIVGAYRKFDGQMTDVYWTDKEKYKKILSSDFRMFSKHLDLVILRERITAKLSEIFMTQVEEGFLNWQKKITTSFFLVRQFPKNYNYWVIFFGSILNQTLFTYRIFRRILVLATQYKKGNQNI